MTTYVIGDLHGCLDPLERLLERLRFDTAVDKLWFVGDLVNRGPQSLQTLRFVKALGDNAITVLGNHDLHFLAVVHGYRNESSKDTFAALLNAPDCDELCHWLSQRPLLHHDESLNHVLVHAGVHPHWSLKCAKKQAVKVQMEISRDLRGVLASMYGNEPRHWSKALPPESKRRFAINVFTRMRYLRHDGAMSFEFNGPPSQAPSDLLPWHSIADRKPLGCRVVFGHWSSHPAIGRDDLVPTDRGCVWNGWLTAYAIESRTSTAVRCR